MHAKTPCLSCAARDAEQEKLPESVWRRAVIGRICPHCDIALIEFVEDDEEKPTRPAKGAREARGHCAARDAGPPGMH